MPMATLTAGGKPPIDNEYMTTREAAQLLRLHPETVREMLRRGDLDGIKTGGSGQCQWRVSRAALKERLTR